MTLKYQNLSFNNLNVLTVGDAMLDQYVMGEVNRISPEAPIPIFTKTETRSTLGGSANVAKNIQSLGANSSLISLVGNDKTGVKLEKQCAANNIKLHRIMDGSRPTTKKERFIAKGQQIMRIDEESIELIDDDLLLKSQSIFDGVLRNEQVDAVIIQDYNKGFLHPKLIEHIIASCNVENIPTIVDPKFQNLNSFKNCSAFKPNLKELINALNREVTPEPSELRKAVQELQERIHFKKAYVTLGSKGIYNYQTNHISESMNIDIMDITGAGDSVVSMLALLIAKSYEESGIAPLLNLIGNLSCRNMGAYAVNIKDINAF